MKAELYILWIVLLRSNAGHLVLCCHTGTVVVTIAAASRARTD